MPRFNGTGPLGAGAGTGWGLGPCGCGGRRGFGFRRFISPKNELATLEEEEKMLEKELEMLREGKAALKNEGK